MKKSTLIIEIIIWIAILSSIVWGISSYIQSIQNDQVELSIDFEDIDGLDIGAPVNFMGVFVGSVESFKMENDQVKILFSLENKELKFPKGSTATVQFTGLVGAKTLEIEPPKKPSHSKQNLIAVTPIRISSFTKMSAKSLEALKEGCGTILHMLGDGAIVNTKNNILHVGLASNDAVEFSNSLYDLIYDARVTILTSLTKINKTLDNNLATTDRILDSMEARNYNEDTIAILRAFKLTIFYFYQNLKESNYKRYLEDFIYAGKSINKRIDQNSLQFFKELKLENIIKNIDYVNNKLIKAEKIIDNLYSKLESPYIKARIIRILKTTGIVKDSTYKMQKAI